jgi:hypothetical protein
MIQSDEAKKGYYNYGGHKKIIMMEWKLLPISILP